MAIPAWRSVVCLLAVAQPLVAFQRTTPRMGLGEAAGRRQVVQGALGTLVAGVLAPVAGAQEEDEVAGSASAAASVAPVKVDVNPRTLELPFNNKQMSADKFLGKKATLVVNVKLDDPLSAAQMPELKRLTDAYWRKGLNIIAVPSDQGYYEPDESFMVRNKIYTAYGFGQFPRAVVLDKMDIVGTNIHPFFRFICRALPNPNGLKRVSLDFEKFLLDEAGTPVRRYPRKYPVELVEKDLQTVLQGKPLPEATEEWKRMWVKAEDESIRSEYAFRKNINYF